MHGHGNKNVTLGVAIFTHGFFYSKRRAHCTENYSGSNTIGRDWAKERDNNDEEEDEHDPVERTSVTEAMNLNMRLGLMTKTMQKDSYNF